MERWRDIPGYEGIYEASDYGNIRTHEGKTTSNAKYVRRVWKQRILKQKYGYRKGGTRKKDARVSLWRDGMEQTHLVSRLVALAWCPGYFAGATVNHKDGNPTNNSADNLEWITLCDNIRHGFQTGLYPQSKCALVDECGNKYVFRSMAVASRYLGRSNGYISNRFKRGLSTAISVDGAMYAIGGGCDNGIAL